MQFCSYKLLTTRSYLNACGPETVLHRMVVRTAGNIVTENAGVGPRAGPEACGSDPRPQHIIYLIHI